jgi:hypothetical protein
VALLSKDHNRRFTPAARMIAPCTASRPPLEKPAACSRSRHLPFFFRLFNGNRAMGRATP